MYQINHLLTGDYAVEVKTEADSNDVMEFRDDDKPGIAMLGFL